MSKNTLAVSQPELTQLRELSARVGCDPLLTQASTGNSSMKLDGVLWIKASGRWMADAKREDILIPLNLAEVQKYVKQRIDPGERYTNASIETAMHAVLPHRVVLHVHCVNTIAWAVRQDAPVKLEHQLDGLRWQWISYVPSGLPLACAIEKVLSASPDVAVFVLGNHGLVIGGDDCGAVEDLLSQVQQRLAICPRQRGPIDYAALAEIVDGSSWDLPDDDAVHALATDAFSRAILSGGLLYPCQSILSNTITLGLFRPVSCADLADQWETIYSPRPFLIIEERGVIVRKTMKPAHRAMLSGLAQVIQRTSPSAPLRYLTEEEVANSSKIIACRYGELANATGKAVHTVSS
jgi:rhamnose utilization protein RhaD (predicted bifunctional aldolase and dehydrogenase)